MGQASYFIWGNEFTKERVFRTQWADFKSHIFTGVALLICGPVQRRWCTHADEGVIVRH